jgi:hypothetical protein
LKELTLRFLSPAAYFYALKDRTTRVYPWMCEPDGGIIQLWNTEKQLTVYTISVPFGMGLQIPPSDSEAWRDQLPVKDHAEVASKYFRRYRGDDWL